ncbi:unnamed protein product [Adineta ricciae]|nr:unnamed protein product [Adineta ricciae]
MMLIGNSCVAELFLSSVILWMTKFTLQNDLTQNINPDSFCIYRGYIVYVGYCAQNYSYLLQAIYRYIVVIHPTRVFWQSKRVQILLISLVWITAILYAFPHLFTGEIVYIADDQTCQMSLRLSAVSVYNLFYSYVIPIQGIIFIYLKLVRYVKEMSKRVMPANLLSRAQRELRMVFRIMILISTLLALGIPYATFILMGYFTQPPEHSFRIAYVFVCISLLIIILILFNGTDPVRLSLMKQINRRPNTVIAGRT